MAHRFRSVIRAACLALFILLTSASYAVPPPARPWQKLEGTLIPNRWNDGDSFHVRAEGKEWIFRLYFVDTPEAETSYQARSVDQAKYFGITEPAAIALGREASAFTGRTLSAGPFVVWTRWRTALGRSKQPRYYAIIMVNGRGLNELLVESGLARIYGTRVPLPDGRDSRTYLKALEKVEAKAKAARRGGWKR